MLKNIMKKTITACCGMLFLSVQTQAVDWCSNNTECGCCEQFWGEADYLYWTIQDAPNTPPLVISSTSEDAVLGSAGSSVVLGANKLDTNWRSGGKFALGYWFDCDHCYGAEVSYFFLPNISKSQSIDSTNFGADIFLNVPYYDVNTGAESFYILSDLRPEELSPGDATVKVSNNMQGAELNGWFKIATPCDFKAGWLVGFRYWNFDEHLKFATNNPYLVPETAVFSTYDSFHTENNFYGAQIGIGGETACDEFFINAKLKLAFGAMCESLDIRGETITNELNTVLGVGDLVVYEGGIFALPSNIGNHKKTKFGFIPEFNINMGYQFTDSFRIEVGYTILYANNVLRASKQIDRNINPLQSNTLEYIPVVPLIADTFPAAQMKTSSFWAQGLNVGLVFQF